MLEGKKILIGVTGSIAAYKIAYLVRFLKKNKALVKVIMTPNAKEFISPLTLATLSENPVLSEFFSDDSGEWYSHVELGNWADLLIVAPATANTISKMANGIADNYLLTVYLSAKCPVFIAPAMDLDMFKHSIIQENISKLKNIGVNIINAKHGELASGLCGEGRMEEPEEILREIKEFFKNELSLLGKKILVTAGPTFENIDAVRFIGNYSSGKMGFAIANECVKRGAEVYFVCGPTQLNFENTTFQRIDVTTAEEMFNATNMLFPKVDICIMSAAVADYKVEKSHLNKIKKIDSSLDLKLIPTKDILLSLGNSKNSNQILVGFALETDNEIENARNKLIKKNLDFIVLNSLNDINSGFNYDTNKITIIGKDNKIKSFELMTKVQVSKIIIDNVEDIIINQSKL